ncbi:hypothetical protein K1719_016030 [Acacia pycnantha]|nr:hypothetical protein K1719_016030 [Acacia pycnantha]
MSSYNYLFKTIIVGDTGVGKSCFIHQFIKKNFQHIHHVTTNVGFEARIISVNDKLIKLYIWDTVGDEIIRGIMRSYYRGAVAALLMYDVTSWETFNHLDSWLKDIREQADPNVTIVLVGNKCDANRRRQVSAEEGELYAKENGLIFLETSVKTGQNVEKAFEEAAKSVCKKVEDGVFDLLNGKYCGIEKGNYESDNKKSRWEWFLL